MAPQSPKLLNHPWLFPFDRPHAHYSFNFCCFYLQSLCRIHLFPSLPTGPMLVEPSLLLLRPWQWLSNWSSGSHYRPLQSVYCPPCSQKNLFKIQITSLQSLHFSMLPMNNTLHSEILKMALQGPAWSSSWLAFQIQPGPLLTLTCHMSPTMSFFLFTDHNHLSSLLCICHSFCMGCSSPRSAHNWLQVILHSSDHVSPTWRSCVSNVCTVCSLRVLKSVSYFL